MGLFYSTQSKNIETYKQTLENLIKDIERDTKSKCEIKVTLFDNLNVDTFVLGKLHERNDKIEVYGVEDQKFKELECVYDNIKCLKDKLNQVNSKHLFSETKLWVDEHGNTHIIGKCKYCNSYNDDRPNICTPNMVKHAYCQTSKCPSHFDVNAKMNLSVSENSTEILNGSYNKIGHYKFL